MTKDLENTTLYKKTLGCLLGGLIGDAIGTPTEGMDYHNIEARFGWVDDFSERMSELVATAPDKAGAELAQYLRIGSVLNGILILAFAFFVSWYGLKGIRTQSMPPIGSWIVEGQQVRRGTKAIAISKLVVALGGLMALRGVASSMILWRLAGQMQRICDGASL